MIYPETFSSKLNLSNCCQQTLSSRLHEFGLIPSKAETSLFLFQRAGVTTYILIYVDDIIITSSSNDAISVLLQELNENFAIKYLGDLHYFLGIEVKRSSSGLLLTQEKYASDLLSKLGMTKCKSDPTPLYYRPLVSC